MRKLLRDAGSVALAALLLAAPAPGRAEGTSEPPAEEGPVKLIAFVGCAAGIVAAASVPVLVLALGACGKIVLDEIGSQG